VFDDVSIPIGRQSDSPIACNGNLAGIVQGSGGTIIHDAPRVGRTRGADGGALMVGDADVLACQPDRGATGGHFDGALVLNGGPVFAQNSEKSKGAVAGHLAPNAHRCVGGNVDVAVKGYAVFNDDLV